MKTILPQIILVIFYTLLDVAALYVVWNNCIINTIDGTHPLTPFNATCLIVLINMIKDGKQSV